MTGKSGVATAVAAPTIVQRIGNGATLLGGGVAVLMRRCGVAAVLRRRCGVANASLRRRAGLSRRGFCLCGAFTAQLRSAPLRNAKPRINGRARDPSSIVAQCLRRGRAGQIGWQPAR